MKVKFWGVRGSIAVPGPRTVRYGGNTTCLEVRSDAGELIILDAGTGVFQLAQALLAQMPIRANLFLTHTHWDHIQGLPFFIPAFIPGNTLRIHGAYDPVRNSGVEEAMAVQLQYSYFPVREAELRARIEYVTLMPGEPVEVGDARITPHLLNHPVIDYGYRIDCASKAVFFTGDHEPHYNIYAPEDEGFASYQELIDERRDSIVAAIRGADLLVADAAYTPEEYPAKKGWGHGTFDSCIELGVAAGVAQIALTHHEPTRSDDALEQCFEAAVQRARQRWSADRLPPILLAHEGMDITL